MTFKSMSTSGTTSSKAGSHFGLDENGSKPILVYKYRSGAKGLEIKTERDLCEELDQGKSLAQLREAFVCAELTSPAPRSELPLYPCQQEVYTTGLQPLGHLGRGPHASGRARAVQRQADPQGVRRQRWTALVCEVEAHAYGQLRQPVHRLAVSFAVAQL
jgi:hypothetical protein